MPKSVTYLNIVEPVVAAITARKNFNLMNHPGLSKVQEPPGIGIACV